MVRSAGMGAGVWIPSEFIRNSDCIYPSVFQELQFLLVLC